MPRILLGVWTLPALGVVVIATFVAVWATVRAVRDRPVILRQLLVAGAVEVLLLGQAVEAGVRALRGQPPADPVTFWGYLLTALLVLPGAAAWAFAERTRWSSVVLAVAAVTVAFLAYRMLVVWAGA